MIRKHNTLKVAQKIELFKWVQDNLKVIDNYYLADIAKMAGEELGMTITPPNVTAAIKEVCPDKIRRRSKEDTAPEACQIECKFEDTMINQQMIEGFMSTILTRLDRIEVALSNKVTY